MLVMHEPMKASSILVPATSDSSLASSGSFGQQTMGSLISFMSISITAAYSASGSASSSCGSASHCSTFSMRRASVLASWYPSAIMFFIRMMFDLRYSMIGSLSSLIVQPAAERSAEASDSSNACSTFSLGRPSISRMRPEKMFFLPALATVSRPALMA